ncbi:MAG: S9 family peptidase [Myxococcales bacterium]|nr:S9 family peptidase [Myxococcales bacterium]
MQHPFANFSFRGPMTFTLAIALTAVTAGAAHGKGAQTARTHKIVAADYFGLAHVAQVAPSPDGAMVAWAELRWKKGNKRRNIDLWVVNSRTQKTRRLTFDSAPDLHPQWSADGKWLYFASNRKRAKSKAPYDGKRQVFRIRPDGTGLMAVTRVAGGIESYHLTGDSAALVYTTGKKHVSKGVHKGLRSKYGKLNYGRGVSKLSHIWRLDLATWRTKRLTKKADRFIRSFDVSADQTRVVAITVPTRKLIDNEGWSKVEIFDLASQKWTALQDDLWRKKAPSPFGWLTSPVFAPDGKKLAFRVDFDGYPGELIVVEVNGTTQGKTWKMKRGGEITLSGHAAWKPGATGGDSELCVKAIRNARHGVYCWEDVAGGKHGDQRIVTAAASGNVSAWAMSKDGDNVAMAMSDVTHPPDVFVCDQDGSKHYKRLTRVNPQVDTWKLPQISTVRWKSADGTQVEGILELPPGYKKASGPLPLVVEIHGGPTSATALELRFWIYGRTLFASRGWALLSPNYRGSTGYGDKFLTDLIGHKNDRDVADIMAGVDALIKRGIAKADQLAVMGWSNGGYLTNCLITVTNRFKAASSGAGVFDTAMQWMIEDTPGHVINYNKGQPWTRSAAMSKSSPLYNVHKVKTPTLIHVGEHDPRVPPQHSRGLFRALDQYLKVPTELIVYPGEGHGLTTYTHREAKMAWDIAWFDRWVLGKGKKNKPKASAKPVKSGAKSK